MASVRSISVLSKELVVLTMVDRRANADPIAWLYQLQLEDLLWRMASDGRSTGACYRLFSRAGLGQTPLVVRRSSVAASLVSDADFELLMKQMHTGARVVTLLPVTAVREALASFGRTRESEALVEALGMELPDGWGTDEENEGEENEGAGHDDEEADGEDEGQGEGEEGGEGAEGEGEANEEGQGSDDEEADAEDVGRGEGEEGGEGAESEGEGGGAIGGGGGSGSSYSEAVAEDDDQDATTDDEDEPSEAVGSTRAPKPFDTLATVSPRLASELVTLTQYRTLVLNKHRVGVAVTPGSCTNDKRALLRFLGWLHRQGKLADPTLAIFGSENIALAVQRWAEDLVKAGRKFSSVTR